MKTHLHKMPALLFLVILAAAGPAGATTEQNSGNTTQVRELINQAQRQLTSFMDALNRLSYEIARTSQGGGMQGALGARGTSTRTMINGREVEREADRIYDIGNDVYKLAAKCGKDGRKVGTDFRSATQRLRNTVRRISSANTEGSAEMAFSRAEMEAGDIYNMLSYVRQIEGCVPDEDGTSDSSSGEDKSESSDKESDDKKQQ